MWIEASIALRFLRQGRTQSLLILVGISVGVAVIVFVTALISGLQANVIDRTLGTQAHIRVEAPREVNRLARAGDGVLQLVLEDPRPQSLRPIDNWLEVRDVPGGVRTVGSLPTSSTACPASPRSRRWSRARPSAAVAMRWNRWRWSASIRRATCA